MKRFLSIIMSLALYADTALADTYTFLKQWGDQRQDMTIQLTKPRGVAVSAGGKVYVSTYVKNQIYRYDNQGNVDKIWYLCDGTPLDHPMQMAFDKNNLLYVADSYNNRVCVYDANGNWQRSITANFRLPLGVAVDNDLNVYVVDDKNEAVKKIDPNGNLVATWEGFNSPWGVHYYKDYLYISDFSSDGMIWKFTTEGLLVKRWGIKGIGDGEFYMAEGIIAYNNTLYVADGEYGRIHVFDLEGNWLRTIGERGTGNAQMQFSTALAIDATNRWLYVSDDDNDRIMRFTLNSKPETFSAQWGSDSKGNTGLRYPTKIALDEKNGVFYLVDSGNHKIRKMTMYPNIKELFSFGSYGSGNGQFRFPFDAAVDSSGNVYVIDNLRRDIQKFSSNGAFQSKYDLNSPPLLTDPLKYAYGPQGLAIDTADNIYVVDAGTDMVYRITQNGVRTGGWKVNFYPSGIALDEGQKVIYVSSFSRDVVTQYTMNGIPTGKQIGQGDAYPNNLAHSYGVAVDRDGTILVADTFHNRVAKFGTSGTKGYFITSIGAINWTGDASAGQFTFPYGVAIDSRGYVYAADTNNHRIQIFGPSHFVFTALSQGQGTISCPQVAVYGAHIACAITPDPGYYLSSLNDNGNKILLPLPSGIYTIDAVATDHTITAGFLQSPPVLRYSGTLTVSYNSPSAAYFAAATGDKIAMQSMLFNESPNFNRNLPVSLLGGYDSSFVSKTGHSVIAGSLTFTSGPVTIENIILMPDAFNISSESQGQGAIICPPRIAYNSSGTCKIAPQAGYYLATLTDNGTSVPLPLPFPRDEYTLTGVLSEHSLKAVFMPSTPVRRVSGGSIILYSTFKKAYAAALNGDILEMQQMAFKEDPYLDRNISLTLSGGFESTFTSKVGYSTFSDSLTISRKTVTIDSIGIK